MAWTGSHSPSIGVIEESGIKDVLAQDGFQAKGSPVLSFCLALKLGKLWMADAQQACYKVLTESLTPNDIRLATT